VKNCFVKPAKFAGYGGLEETDHPMYIVALAWLYVTLLMALTEPSVIAGLATFFFYGLAPLALFLYLVGTPQRRRNQRKRSGDDPQQ
jgi:hypothetical protein